MPSSVSFAFLHGGGQAGWIWDETLAALAAQAGGAGVPAIAFDLPGCGTKRAQDLTGLTVRDVAAAFVDDLARSGLRDIVLVGHSNAGTIMPLVAQMRPDLVARYVYVSCMAPPPGQTVRQVMASRHAIPASAADAAPLDRLRTMFCNDMAAGQIPDFLGKLGHDHWPTLSSLDETGWHYDHLADKPATYVICLQDQALPAAWQETFAARLHVQRLVRIDAGHQAMNTRPHALAEILRHEAGLLRQTQSLPI